MSFVVADRSHGSATDILCKTVELDSGPLGARLEACLNQHKRWPPGYCMRWSSPPRGYIKCWSGTEAGLANLGALYVRIIVGLATLLLSNRSAQSYQR